MKFTVSRTVALATLSQALKTCNVKAQGQIDSEFLFRVSADDGISVTSFNEIVEQTIQLEAENITANDASGFSVSGQAVVEFLKQFQDDIVECSYDPSESLFVMGSAAKKTRIALPAGVPDEFVLLSVTQRGARIELEGSALATALRQAAFCASTDPSRAPLTAVHVTIVDTNLTAEGTDQMRISQIKRTIDDIGTSPFTFLLPRSAAETLSSLLENTEKVVIVPCDRHIRFEWDDAIFTSSLENGIGKAYPNVTRFLNGEEVCTAKVSRGDMLRALKLSSLIANKPDSYVKVKISSNGLTLTTNEQERGASADVVPVQEGEGEGETMVSCRYLQKAVDIATAPWLNVKIRTLLNKSLAISLEDEGFVHCIFPITPRQPSSTTSTNDSDSDSNADTAQD